MARLDDFKILVISPPQCDENWQKLLYHSPETAGQSSVDSVDNCKDGSHKIMRAYLEDSPYALVVVDLSLSPNSADLHIIKEFLAVDKTIQVLIYSTCDTYSWMEIMTEIGISDRIIFLKKPFAKIELQQLVATLKTKWQHLFTLNEHVKKLKGLIDEQAEALKNALSIATATLESTHEGMVVVNQNGHILNYNKRFVDMWHISHDLIETKSFKDVLSFLHDQVTEHHNLGILANNNSPEYGKILEFKLQDGQVYEGFVQAFCVDEIEQGRLYCFKNITQRRNFERELMYKATHDYLTGLPNRILLVDRLKQSLAYARRHKQLLAVLYLDVDSFKYINDTLGHNIGDGLLQAVAGRIRVNIREADTICRLGGDEFVLILTGFDTKEDIEEMIQRLYDSLKSPFYLNEHILEVVVSIGVSIFPEHGEESDLLLSHADTALYDVKEGQRGTWLIYSQGMTDDSCKLMALEAELHYAIDRGQLSMNYQPIISAKTGKIVGLEALLRWSHPTLGQVSPAEFIPIAEKAGMVIPIGEWVFETVSEELCAWQKQGIPDIYVSINVSGIQLNQPDFLAKICNKIAHLKVDPKYFEFELTETILLEHSTHILGTLNQFKEMDIKISLDDFGTGYSSLSYLKRFPVDKIKIDRSFINNMHVEQDSLEIVTAIIAMSHKLGLKVVAEGVEHYQTVKLLQENDCDLMQGFLFCEPVSGDIIASMLLQQNEMTFLPAIKRPSNDIVTNQVKPTG